MERDRKRALESDKGMPPSKQPKLDAVEQYQRAQLVSLVRDQRKEMDYLRDKVEEQKHVVSFLDAAPRAALYHMASVREDLTLTLARLGLPGNESPENCPIAATLLNVEEITNESLGELPAQLKSTTAQLIIALEKHHKTVDVQGNASRDIAAHLHDRIRKTSEQLERFAEREKKMVVASSNLSDELEDVKRLNAMRRNRIVNLEEALRVKEMTDTGNTEKNADSKRAPNDKKSSPNRLKQDRANPSSSHKFSDANGAADLSEISSKLAAEREQSAKRLKELEQMHQEKKRLISQLESLRCDLAKRDAGVITVEQVLSAALFQTMEATLQQLYLKEKKWQKERESMIEDQNEERKAAEERLAGEQHEAKLTREDFQKQIAELRKHVDLIKAEKDKAAMSYEARKMESNSVSSVNAAWEKKLAAVEEMRSKAVASTAALKKELSDSQNRLRECERIIDGKLQSHDGKELIKNLRQELEDEKKKSSSFIGEVESLSNMYGELEQENSQLVKLLAEKEQILSKIMGERLRARQQLTTTREENKALLTHRTMSNERIRNMTAVVEASKKLAADAQMAHNLAVEETRKLSAQLERRRRIADDMTVKTRTALAEKEEMKKERDAYLARAESHAASSEDNRFAVKRLKEENADLKKQIESIRLPKANGNEDSEVRDELIRDLRKTLDCSVSGLQVDVVLTRCGHLFNKKCTDDLIATRNRKCPACGKAFGVDDVMNVYF